MKNLGLIGIGAIAQSYIGALEGCEWARISAVADARTDAVTAAVESLSCDGYHSYQEMADQADCDGVIICTPPVTHPEMALCFLERGIPVLCEKPLSVDTESAEAMVNSARRSGVLFSMASKFRYVEDVIRTKAIIASGLIGDARLLENAFVARVDMSRRWNSDPSISGGGVVIDNGTHSFDIVRYLLGPITRVLMIESASGNDLRVEDDALLLAETASGAMVRIDLSWTFDKQLPEYLRLYGSDGTIHVGWKNSRYKQSGNSDWINFGKGYNKISAFQGQLRNFCDAIDGQRTELVTTADALASVRVIQAAYQSVREKGWVDVPQEPELELAETGFMALDAAE